MCSPLGHSGRWNLPMWSYLTLGPLLQGQTRIAKVKCAYNSIIKLLFISKTMLVVLLWIHLASGHRCILGLVENGTVDLIFILSRVWYRFVPKFNHFFLWLGNSHIKTILEDVFLNFFTYTHKRVNTPENHNLIGRGIYWISKLIKQFA